MRQTQLETLALAARVPDALITSDVAHEFGRSIRAAEQRIGRLVASGHLRRRHIGDLAGGSIECFEITPRGRAALREARS